MKKLLSVLTLPPAIVACGSEQTSPQRTTSDGQAAQGGTTAIGLLSDVQIQ